MKPKLHAFLFVPALLALATLNAPLSTVFAQGTAFTYQGQIQNNGSPAGGTYNLTFTLFTNNAGGTAVAGPVTNNSVAITNGLFTVLMDFGTNVFTGTTNWLEIGVKTNGAGSFSTLAPRQQLTPVPNAIYAESAAASGIVGTLVDAQLLHSAVTVNPGPGLSGGGRVGLGNTIILTNTGVLSVTGNADITAATVGGAVTLGDTATSADTAGTLVKRDGTGGFSANSVTLDGNLNLPNITPGNPDVIYTGGSVLLYDDNSGNFAGGLDAGYLGTSGALNTAVGSQALEFNSAGSENTAVGTGALFANGSGNDNTAVGYNALTHSANNYQNTATGSGALSSPTSGSGNTANGFQALVNNTSGDNNTGVGVDALGGLNTGSNNTALGYAAGNSIGSGSFNIDIGNSGLASDTDIIRIGGGQTAAYIAGVINGNGGGLTNLSTAQLTGTVSNSQLASSSVTINPGAGLSGGGVVGLGGSTTLSNTGVLSVTGNADITANTVGGMVTLGDTGTSSATAGLLVKRDGTGSFSATNLTLNGVLNLPATTATAGIIYSGGNLLLHTYGSQNFFAGTGAGNLTMTGAGNTGTGYGVFFLNKGGGNNTADGFESLFNNTNGSDNTAIGYEALDSNTGDVLNDGSSNTATGFQALYFNTIGNDNTASGAAALYSNTNGSYNTAFGTAALYSDKGGSNNIALGNGAGQNVTNGNNNIEIGNAGNASDNNDIRIGTTNVQTATFIAGISGATAASGVAVYVNTNGQLGTLTSSRRYKDDIQGMDRVSDVLYALQPVTFKYKSGIDPQGIPQFGLVAEDVEKVDPDLVAHDGQGDIYTVRYQAVDAMLLNEFLKEHRQVEQQNVEIAALKEKAAKVDSMEERLAELEQVVQSLAAHQ